MFANNFILGGDQEDGCMVDGYWSLGGMVGVNKMVVWLMVVTCCPVIGSPPALRSSLGGMVWLGPSGLSYSLFK